MIRPDGAPQKWHLRLGRRTVSLLVVAADTRTHKILPGIVPTTGTRNDMIDCQGDIGPAAVLTAVAIAAENILTGENDLLEGDSDIDGKTNDAWKGHRHRHRMEQSTVESSDQLGFSQIQKDNRFFDIADTEGLVIVIENENLTVNPNNMAVGISVSV